MNKSIRIAILDAVPESYWADDRGITDSQKFIDLLQPFNTNARLDAYYVSKNQFPGNILDYDAFLVTGSPCSVHDEHDWIARLADLVRESAGLGKRVIGSCFGHQLVARAFGGEVGHNENGWLIGNFDLRITGRYDWMQPVSEITGMYHFNQERVTRLPKAAKAFAHTDHYADHGYTIGDNVMCFQGHPEQSRLSMINFLRATASVTPEQRERAVRNIEAAQPDAHIWGEWMMRFMLA
ncbi:MAG: type 1 glutamine amidotransferase [Gammaproteobacteria bacterium]|nr:type 1 glutamine amidotransferase [Gammaproteobacteria bacterium]MDH3447724.1 type 1 glutamine amidotransferase [Gammaproteobacteria bacterium]